MEIHSSYDIFSYYGYMAKEYSHITLMWLGLLLIRSTQAYLVLSI